MSNRRCVGGGLLGFILLAATAAGLVAAPQSGPPPTKSFVYKKTKQADLEIVIHFPPGWKEADKRPAVVFFFGGGWEQGTIRQFEPQATHLASRGMVAARADYRVKSRQGVTPKECVEDAKSAIRWVRKNAAKLGIDPTRIVAAGGSAGGHIAACTALTPGLDAEDEDAGVSSKPNVLVLFNPVLRFSGIPQLMERIGNDETVGKALSPTLQLTKDSPPTLIFFGTADRLAVMGDEFMKKSKELGHRAEMFTAEGQPHGFFNRPPWLEKTTGRMDEFLVSLGYLEGKGEKTGSSEWTSTFDVDKANLTSIGRNPYFIPLEPGYRLILKGDGATLTVTVTDKTRLVDGVQTRVVEEREEKGGRLIEVSQNYFAIDKTTNAVYYFGEDVDIYKEGKMVSHEGAWLSGIHGAKFGMMMPGKPRVGDKFQQEVAPKVAMDRCEIAAIGEEVETPAGTFENCLRTKESSPLEKGTSEKVFAPGVVLIKDDEFVLLKVETKVGTKKAATTALQPGGEERPTKKAYVPEPQPVRTQILVGAHNCPLWEVDQPQMWDQVLKHPERTPALGFYSQENPEVADWETRWAVEHGVSFFVYCWYRNGQGGPVKMRFGSAIHDALFKSRYVSKMKFTIMWENQAKGVAGVSSEADLMHNLLPFWMDNYFRHPSYLKIDNKPLLFIYRPEFLIQDLGGVDKVREAMDKMRRACRTAGFDNLYLLGEYRGLDPKHLELMKQLGLDYTFAYCWHVQGNPSPQQAIAAQLDYIDKTRRLGILPQVVTVSQGWSGWHDEGSIWKIPPTQYKELLEKAKAVIRTFPAKELGSRMLLLDNWNEWSEGHYLAPHREYGFGYLDAVREVFSAAPRDHVDLLPKNVGMGPYDQAYRRQVGTGK